MKRSKPDLSQIIPHEANAHSNAGVTPSSNASTRSSTQPTDTMYEGSESVGWGGTPIITSSMFESLSRAADRILSGKKNPTTLTQEELREKAQQSLERLLDMSPLGGEDPDGIWMNREELLGYIKEHSEEQ